MWYVRRTQAVLWLCSIGFLTGCPLGELGLQEQQVVQSVSSFSGFTAATPIADEANTTKYYLSWLPVTATSNSQSISYEIYGITKKRFDRGVLPARRESNLNSTKDYTALIPDPNQGGEERLAGQLLGVTQSTAFELKIDPTQGAYSLQIIAVVNGQQLIGKNTVGIYPYGELPDSEAPKFDGLKLASTMNHQKVYLKWDASESKDLSHYVVYSGPGQKNLVGQTEKTEYIVGSLVSGINASFKVEACDASGNCSNSGVVKQASTMSFQAPDFNGLVSAKAPGGISGLTSVNLSWQPSGGTVTGYRVYMATSSQGFDFSTPKATVNSVSDIAGVGDYVALKTSVATTVQGLQPDTTYFFVVRAFSYDATTLETITEVNTIERIGKTNAVGANVQSATITSISPSFDVPTGGKTVTITGTNFMPNASLSLGSNACVTLTYVSATELKCVTSPHAVATVSVNYQSVINGAATLANGFFYTSDAAPTISSVSPQASPLSGAALIDINGTNFVNGATVKIGTIDCIAPTFVSATKVRCTTPAMSSGSYDVILRNPDSQTATKSSGISYMPPPTVTSISPSVGHTSGSTILDITGTNLAVPAIVKIGTLTCTGVQVITAGTQLRCVTPVGTAGTYDVSVTNGNTLQTGTLSNSFLYTAANPPTVTNIEPAAGSILGGTTIVLTGSNFAATSQIYVDGTLCPSFAFTNSTSISCSTLSHGAGAVDIRVTNTDGQQVLVAGGYTFTSAAAPNVLTVTPAAGPPAGGTAITITGTDFVNGASVKIGTSTCGSVTFDSSTQIRCTTQAGSLGAQGVKVINPDTQFGLKAAGFQYTANPAPTVTAVTPNQSQENIDKLVTVFGTGFQAGASVTFGALPCTGVSVLSATQLTCTVAGGSAGVYDITVTNADTQQGTGSNLYSFIGPVAIGSVLPNQGTFFGGTSIAVNGSGFVPGTLIYLDGVACSAPVLVNSTKITCNTPKHAIGAVDVKAVRPDTTETTLSNSYTYAAGPGILEVSPNTGFAQTGGELMTIYGRYFAVGVSVKIGSDSCLSVTRVSDTELTCSTPLKGSDGFYDITVTNPDGQWEAKYKWAHYGTFTYPNTTLSVAAGNGDKFPRRMIDSANKDDARFREIRGLEVVGTDLYVTEIWGGVLRKVNLATGATTTPIGTAYDNTNTNSTQVGTAAQQRQTVGIVYDSTRDILYYSTGEGRCIKAADMSVSPPSASRLAGHCGSHSYVDGPGSAARFNDPKELAQDSTYLYVYDYGNRRIRRIHKDTAVVSTIAGDGTNADVDNAVGTSGSVGAYTRDLAVHGTKLYLANSSRKTIRVIDLADANFPISVYAGADGVHGSADGAVGTARFSSPFGLVVVGDDLYVTDSGALRKIDLNTDTVSTVVGSGLPSNVRMTHAAGKLYMPQTEGHRYSIMSYDLSGGTLATLAGPTSDFDHYGDVDGAPGTSMLPENGSGQLRYGSGIYFVAHNKVKRLRDSDGHLETVIGSSTAGYVDGTGAAVRFSNLDQMVRIANRAFLFDVGNRRIRILNLDTLEVTTLTGNGTYGFTDGDVATATMGNFYGGVTTDYEYLYFMQNEEVLRRVKLDTGAVDSVVGAAGVQSNVYGAFSVARIDSSNSTLAIDKDRKIYLGGWGRTSVIDLVGQTVTNGATAPRNSMDFWGDKLFTGSMDTFREIHRADQTSTSRISVVNAGQSDHGKPGALATDNATIVNDWSRILFDGDAAYVWKNGTIWKFE